MDFRILGPVEVLSGDRALPLGGERQRALLSYLLLHANEVVAGSRLLDELWAEPPGGGLGALQTQVSRLRRILEGRILTVGSGYSIRVEEGELDLDRFRSLLAEAGATADPAQRSATLREADALWRGIPLEGIDVPFASVEISALEELRLAALEDRIDAELELSRDRELVAELSTLVARYPLRERLRAQLILALYRSGRQADALEAYRSTRQMLDEKLGLEPSPALRELERAILRHDPALAAKTPQQIAPATRRRRRRVVGLVAAAVGLASLAGGAIALSTDGDGTTRGKSHARRPASASAQVHHAVTISDRFNSDYIDPTIWAIVADGGDVSAAEEGGRLVLTVGPKAVPGGTYDQIDVHAGTQCSFPGDFDARVDYKLLDWPAADNVWVGLNAIYASAAVMREATSQFGDIYRSWVTTANGNIPLPDTSGSMRISRVDGMETTYFWHEGRWRKLASAPSPGAAVLGLGASSGASDSFGRKEVRVAFDNFHVTARNPVCPP
jgi:DNA-binding SARP family transcriptional activator